jgi:hypothetical protein
MADASQLPRRIVKVRQVTYVPTFLACSFTAKKKHREVTSCVPFGEGRKTQ